MPGWGEDDGVRGERVRGDARGGAGDERERAGGTEELDKEGG